MGCSSTTNNCCPEAPDITVNEYTVTLGGDGANFHTEIFGIGDSASSAGLVFTLSYSPVQAAEVLVAINGSVQRPTTDFTLSDTTLTLTSAISSTDVVTVKYLGAT